jgi:GDP-4-dehydro-6-deoxy-D-mannose reductase
VKKILITGGLGALGQALCTYISQNTDYQVITLGRQQAVGEQIATHLVCDVCDSVQLATVFRRVQPDMVLHLAARLLNTLEEAYLSNVVPAQKILELVQESYIKTRVVLIGSAAEYGIVHPYENPIEESRILVPVSIYGISKAWQTQLLKFYSTRGVNVVCARIFNLYGKGISEHLFVGRLQKQMNAILERKASIIQIGSLAAIRDYISTDEASIQLLSIAQYGKQGDIYHVASGIPISMRAMLEKQLALFGLDSSIVQESSELSNRQGYDVPEIYADISKTKNLLNIGSIRA